VLEIKVYPFPERCNRGLGKDLINFLGAFNSGEMMKAELVYGRLVRIQNDTLTLEIEKGLGEREEVQYHLDVALDEGWIADNLGKYMNVVVIDGKVKGFRSE
jgi:hypothetical protein